MKFNILFVIICALCMPSYAQIFGGNFDFRNCDRQPSLEDAPGQKKELVIDYKSNGVKVWDTVYLTTEQIERSHSGEPPYDVCEGETHDAPIIRVDARKIKDAVNLVMLYATRDYSNTDNEWTWTRSPFSYEPPKRDISLTYFKPGSSKIEVPLSLGRDPVKTLFREGDKITIRGTFKTTDDETREFRIRLQNGEIDEVSFESTAKRYSAYVKLQDLVTKTEYDRLNTRLKRSIGLAPPKTIVRPSVSKARSVSQTRAPRVQVYPESAKRRGLEGNCKADFYVFPDGKAYHIDVNCSSDVFNEAAVEAIQVATYSPARDDFGDPVIRQYSSRVTFALR